MVPSPELCDNSVEMWGTVFRPRIRERIALAPDEAIRKLQTGLDSTGLPVVGLVSERLHHAELRIRSDERHFWSPCLGMQLEPVGSGSHLHGQIGPHPSLWVGFAFVYITAMSAACFGLIFGLVQWSLDMAPWALWVVPAAILVCAVLLGVSRTGQKLADAQMVMMQRFLLDCLADDRERAPVSPG